MKTYKKIFSTIFSFIIIANAYWFYRAANNFQHLVFPVKVIDAYFRLDGGTRRTLFKDKNNLELEIGIQLNIIRNKTYKILYTDIPGSLFPRRVIIYPCSEDELEMKKFFLELSRGSPGKDTAESGVANSFIHFIKNRRNSCV